MFIVSGSQESSTGVSSPSSCLSIESARARLAHDVRVALRRAGHRELRSVEVVVDGERVLITGCVPSFYLKQLSQELARHAAPRHRICNQLNVEPLTGTS